MLGGISGGGMGFIFDPRRKTEAQDYLQQEMSRAKRELQHALPFAMEPVVYDFAVNDQGTSAELWTGGEADAGRLLWPVRAALAAARGQSAQSGRPRRDRPVRRRLPGHSATGEPGSGGAGRLRRPRLPPPPLRRFPPRCCFPAVSPAGRGSLGAVSLRRLLEENGFDPELHEQIRADLRAGRIGLSQNRIALSSTIENVLPGDVVDCTGGNGAGTDSPSPLSPLPSPLSLGEAALAGGEVAVLTLAAGAGSRWTQGAGVVKALHPFCRFQGQYRNFIEVHLAKSRRTAARFGAAVPHVITTSHLTHQPIDGVLRATASGGYPGPLLLSPGRSIGLRMVPMARDLRFAWQELPQQVLDVQAQKVRESLQAALIAWAESAGGGATIPTTCPCSACTRWATGSRSPTSCATARWPACWPTGPR